MNQTVRETEQKYLEKVLAYIDRQLVSAEADAEDASDELLEEKRVFWDEGRHILRDFDDVLNFSTMNAKITLAEERRQRVREEIVRLQKLRYSPYFGRMDFVEEKIPEHIYIGIHNLMDNDTFDSLVYDWRASICSALIGGYRKESAALMR